MLPTLLKDVALLLRRMKDLVNAPHAVNEVHKVLVRVEATIAELEGHPSGAVASGDASPASDAPVRIPTKEV